MKKIIFMGTPQFAATVLKKLLEAKQNLYQVIAVVSQPDKPVGRNRVLAPTAVKEVAQDYNIPVLQPEKIKDIYDDFLTLNPDLIVTAAYGQIVPENILAIPKYKCINVHGSLLPKYRGGAPIHYAIINGDKETGITIMYMEKKMDAGAMLFQKAIPILPEDNLETMFIKMQNLGAEMLLEMLPRFFANEIVAVEQNEAEVTFSPTIKREQCQIHWDIEAECISNLVRGLYPTPAAYTTINETQVKIFEIEILEETANAKPGTIIKADNKTCIISTKTQNIALKDLQISGKKRQLIENVMNGAGRNLFIEGDILD